MAAATVQMNMRIGVEEKSAGDAALREVGFTPSAAVRALWKKAALGGEDLRQVATLLGGASSSNRRVNPMPPHDASIATGSPSPGVEPLARGRELVPAFFANLGLTSEAISEDAPGVLQDASAISLDKEIEAALVERYKERGLL